MNEPRTLRPLRLDDGPMVSRPPGDADGRLRRFLLSLADSTTSDSALRFELLDYLLGKNTLRLLGIYAIPDDFLLSVVIPVFNEVNTVGKVVHRVLESTLPIEVIVVDDGSTDGTRQVLEQWRKHPKVKMIFHEQNLGKGAALKTGFRQATGTAVVVQDADLEYDPAEYPKLVQPIIEGRADVVYGSRFSGDSQRVLSFWHYVGNRFLTLLSNMFTNLNLSDMETCYKVFRRETIQQIAPTLKEQRFGIEPELTAKLAGLPGIRVFERPISYSGRTYEEGKKIGWRDGLRALWCIIRYSRGIRR